MRYVPHCVARRAFHGRSIGSLLRSARRPSRIDLSDRIRGSPYVPGSHVETTVPYQRARIGCPRICISIVNNLQCCTCCTKCFNTTSMKLDQEKLGWSTYKLNTVLITWFFVEANRNRHTRLLLPCQQRHQVQSRTGASQVGTASTLLFAALSFFFQCPNLTLLAATRANPFISCPGNKWSVHVWRSTLADSSGASHANHSVKILTRGTGAEGPSWCSHASCQAGLDRRCCPIRRQKLDSQVFFDVHFASAVLLPADPVRGSGKRNATPSDVDAVLCVASNISKCFPAIAHCTTLELRDAAICLTGCAFDRTCALKGRAHRPVWVTLDPNTKLGATGATGHERQRAAGATSYCRCVLCLRLFRRGRIVLHGVALHFRFRLRPLPFHLRLQYTSVFLFLGTFCQSLFVTESFFDFLRLSFF